MTGLHALAWRSLRARPLRTTLTTIGVALGVAVLYAGLATNAGIDAAVDRAVTTMVGKADLRVASFGEGGLSSATVDTIEALPGVAVAAPTVEQRTYLGLDLFAPGDALPAPVTVVGIVPAAEAALHDLAIGAGTALPETASVVAPSALVSATLAREDGLRLGDTLEIQGPAAPTTVEVVGILAGDGPWSGATGRAVVVPLAVAQAAFDTVGVTRVDVALEPGTTAATVVDGLGAAIVDGPYLVSSPAELGSDLRASTGEFAATTALIAAIALFAGAFLIFNTLSMTVVERIRELGLLRAAGASRGQLTSFILVQAVVIGVAGSVLGVALGVGLATLMAAWVGTVGSIARVAPTIAPLDLSAAVAIGLAVTLAAAAEPARRAGRVPPVEALKARLELPAARRARVRWLVGVFAVVGVVGLLVWPRAAGDGALIRSLAVYGVLLVVVLAIPFVLPALTRLAGTPYAIVARLEERLARASILRDRARATLTVGALTVGLALIVALGGLGQHARAAASAWVADVVPGDLVVTSIFPRPLDEGLGETLGALPGIASVSPIATFDLAIDGVRADGAAMVGADLAADGRLRLRDGDRATALAALDAGGAVIVPAGAAAAQPGGLRVGEPVVVAAADGSALTLTVAGIAERSLPGRSGESWLVGWPDAERLGLAGADAFAVRFDPSATDAQRTALADEARALALEPTSLGRIQGAIGEALDRVFGLFDALAVIAVIVAALGIVNTLSMNVLERVREIGVLRAAGMTRRQVWRSVVVEAGVTGLVGAVCGIAAGIGVGALMVVFAGGPLSDATTLPWPAIGVALVLGVVLAVLAAAYPARLASRVSIVRAVGYE
jgi:putative ABC transport system permease protein